MSKGTVKVYARKGQGAAKKALLEKTSKAVISEKVSIEIDENEDLIKQYEEKRRSGDWSDEHFE